MSGIRLSMQRSYARRAPAKASVPHLVQARDGLRQLVERQPTLAEAWKLLSQAEECLLNYDRAILCLEMAMSLSGKRDKRDLKRLAMLRESVLQWRKLPLTPVELRELGEYLVEQGADKEMYGRSLKFTSQWLEQKCFTNVNAILQALNDRGGRTDFTILYNVVRG
ncbi:MAG: hypothetical protein WD851_15825 [Pirellulales bacterium]